MKKFPYIVTLLLCMTQGAKAFYDPSVGKWLNRDPKGEAGGVNLTAYCGNDPVNQVDPLGLDYLNVSEGVAWWVVQNTAYGDLPLRVGTVTSGKGSKRVKIGNFFDNLGWNTYTDLSLSELKKFADKYDSKYGYDSIGKMDLDGIHGKLRMHLGNLQGSTWLMANKRKAALLAHNVYSDTGDTPDASRIIDPASRGIDERLFTDYQGEGFHASLYRMSDSSAYALVFRGTQFESKEDWKNNFGQGSPFMTSLQYEQAKDLGREVQSALKNERLVVIGHSLGGGLATAASIRINRPSMTFNPAGLRRSTVKGFNFEMARAFINVYRVKGEILTTVQDASPVLLGLVGGVVPAAIVAIAPNTTGRVHSLSSPKRSYGPVERHDMSVVIEALDLLP